MKLLRSIIMLLISLTIYGKNEIDLNKMKIKTIDPDKTFFNNLEQIKDRLEKKDDQIDRKKRSLEELKKEISGIQIEIKKYEETITANIKKFVKDEEEKVDLKVARLVRIYETMKAKNVAKIVEEMDESLVIAVFLKLKESRVGEIMRYLTPKKSAKLSEKLTLWKKKYNLDKKIGNNKKGGK